MFYQYKESVMRSDFYPIFAIFEKKWEIFGKSDKIIVSLQPQNQCTMFVEFATKNFLSFKNEVAISMLAAKSVKEGESLPDGASNIFEITETGNKFTRIASIYGANGSGKSSLIKAMAFYRNMIIGSVNNDHILSGFVNNQFRLSSDSTKEPSCFQMIFIINKIKYRYGFEVLGEKVDSEWLFQQEYSSQKESYCFKRADGDIQVNAKTFKEAKALESLTRDNALFLSTAAQFNVPTAMLIKDWISRRFNILSGINDDTLNYTALQYLQNETMRERILNFIKIIDLGIQDISVKENFIDKISDSTIIPNDPLLQKIIGGLNEAMNPAGNKIRELNILAAHNKYEGENIIDKVALPFQSESVGTVKIFALLGPWLDTLANGGTLVVDEFGASIHTKLALELIRLFQSKLNNGEAQLIVNTHDTNLLRKDLLRRDQIWFAEKDAHGVSDIYSLVEYKINQATSVRNDATFSKDYLMGKYGAIPYFGNIEKFIADYSEESNG